MRPACQCLLTDETNFSFYVERSAKTTDEITAEILRRIEPTTGKRLYTNDKAREIEIRRRQRESAEWRLWAARLDDTEGQGRAAAAKLERIRGEFSLHRCVV